MSDALHPDATYPEAGRPDDTRRELRRRRLDRLDAACLTWAGLFAVATGALVLALR